MIVMKFGGSSLESAGAIQQAAYLVKQNLQLFPVVVVSAMGNTTDRLLEAAEGAATGSSYSTTRHVEAIRRLHYQETRALLGPRAEPFLGDNITPLFLELQEELVEITEGRRLTPEIQDRVLSYGERMSSLTMAEALRREGINASQVDARKLIVTNEQFGQALPFYWETYARLRRTVALVAKDRVVVMGGFIAATYKGATTTLGRGGSDLTASLVGAGISADEIQIWTDVDGMLTCDPRVLSGCPPIPEISYEEAQEMARCGAKVLCPTSIAPALRQRIPIVIRNSRRPEAAGTRVVSSPTGPAGAVKSLACKTGLALVHMRVKNSAALSSITDGLADLFATAMVDVELIQAREQGIVFAVRNWPGLGSTLRQVDENVEIAVEEDRAAIWLVGQEVAHSEANLTRALEALRNEDLRMTAQGSSSVSLGFVVPEDQLRSAVKHLHNEFFPAPDSHRLGMAGLQATKTGEFVEPPAMPAAYRQPRALPAR
ncbi:MAG: aspartate kinase [Bryobacteraceae bacterium]